jgi:type I restriction enzyme S subunit
MKKEKRYPNYYDFNQEWLGELPDSWQVMKTKYLFDLICEQAPPGNSEELLSVYTAIGVKPRKELESRGNKASSTDNYWIVKEGDIIVNKLLAWMGAIGISEYNGVTSPAYDVLRPKPGINPFYYNYLFRSPIASREFKRHSRGIMDMRLRLYFSRFGDIKLPLPSTIEQDKIVEFLNFKLSKIDRFIRKKKQLINLLNEQKEAIIDRIVARGLDPNVKMKASGFNWLDTIPENWTVEKGNSLFDLKNDIISVKEIKDLNVVHYSIPNIQEYGEGMLEEGKTIDSNKFLLNGDELLYSKLNPRKGTVVISKKHEEITIASSEFVILIPKGVDILYYYYVLKSHSFKEAISSQVRSATKSHERIKPIIVLKTFFPKPSIEEQKEIARYLQEEEKSFEKILNTIQNELLLVEEYKTSLIAETVLGKIDVNDFISPHDCEEQYDFDEIENEFNVLPENDAAHENETIEE